MATQATADSASTLETARVWVRDSTGREHPVRAFIDPGSKILVIAESLAQRTRLPRSPKRVSVFGINGQYTGEARSRVTLSLSARQRDFTLTVSAFVLPKVSLYTGAIVQGTGTWPHIQDLNLADPDYLARDPVEILLGAHAYGIILQDGVRKGSHKDPVAQRTSLGWILLGGENTDQVTPVVNSLHCSHEKNISTALRRFWDWEEPSPVALPATYEEHQCEEFFRKTFTRLSNGRFQVRLPFRTTPSLELAHTKHAAVRMLNAMDRRFTRDAHFKQLHEDFIREYLCLQHMSSAPQNSALNITRRHCYLPHHGVLKTAESTAKLRVVFNGSARTPSGTSLNDFLFSGPNLLPLLPEIILRWRRHQFAIVADVEKMFRQVRIHPEDRSYQRVLWNHEGVTKEYQLNTVTYGTACAPFLAIRVLRQLAEEDGKKYPAGAAALKSDCYVDDILSGADTLSACQRLQRELSALCMAGGFPLRKWASNHPRILDGVPVPHRQSPSEATNLLLADHSVLGLRWQSTDDTLSVAVAELSTPVATKRSILSQVAKLFDPLGMIAPVVVLAKLLIQTAWLQQLERNTPLPSPETALWTRLGNDLQAIESIKVPRWFTGFNEGRHIEVHGFSDASERAYGAIIYLRIIQAGKVKVSFVQAKTNVTPLKRVSLSRLELCGAALLAKLSCHIKEALGLTNVPTFHWTDSMGTLAWIRGHPAKWTTFVANRVSEIQRASQSVRWRHVPGAENPADCASRGLLPNNLAAHATWWQGPPFLKEDPQSWPSPDYSLPVNDVPDQRPLTCLASTHDHVEPPELLRFLSLRRLLHVTAWMLRWRSPLTRKLSDVVVGNGSTLHPSEIDAALKTWILVTRRFGD